MGQINNAGFSLMSEAVVTVIVEEGHVTVCSVIGSSFLPFSSGFTITTQTSAILPTSHA